MPTLDVHDPAAHRAVMEQARARRESSLRDPTGWLSLVGLHWLHPGKQHFGGNRASRVVEVQGPLMVRERSVADSALIQIAALRE
jgi:uncharacterized protein (DUF1684 family)